MLKPTRRATLTASITEYDGIVFRGVAITADGTHFIRRVVNSISILNIISIRALRILRRLRVIVVIRPATCLCLLGCRLG